jgi:hypothetical protein
MFGGSVGIYDRTYVLHICFRGPLLVRWRSQAILAQLAGSIIRVGGTRLVGCGSAV